MPIFTSWMSISMPPRATTMSKKTLAVTCAPHHGFEATEHLTGVSQSTHRKRCLGRQHDLNPAVCDARPPAHRHAEASAEADGAADAHRGFGPDRVGELDVEQLLLNRREERLWQVRTRFEHTKDIFCTRG